MRSLHRVASTSLFTATLAATLVSGACKKAGDSAAGGGGSVATSADLALLPANADFVAGFNVKQLQGSALYKKYIAPQILSGDAQAKITEFKTTCGFDPLTTISSVALAGDSSGNDFVVVVHGPDKTKTLACLDKEKAKIEENGSKMTRDGDVVLIDGDGKSVATTFTDASTMVIASGKYGSKDGLKTLTTGAAALKSSAIFLEMYKKIDTSKSVWFFVNGNAKAFDSASGVLPTRPKAIFGSLNVTDGIALDARVRVDSDGKATEMVNTFKGQIEGLKSMADKADLTADGSDVRLTVAMSAAKLESAIQTFGPMLMGGMLGMGR